jgi:hypothetical protein
LVHFHESIFLHNVIRRAATLRAEPFLNLEVPANVVVLVTLRHENLASVMREGIPGFRCGSFLCYLGLRYQFLPGTAVASPTHELRRLDPDELSCLFWHSKILRQPTFAATENTAGCNASTKLAREAFS